MLFRMEFYKPEVWRQIIHAELGDDPDNIEASQQFVFIIITKVSERQYWVSTGLVISKNWASTELVLS